MATLKVSTAFTRMFKLISSTDHLTAKTSAIATVNLSKAGAAFGTAAGSVTEVASGWYKIALTTADTGTLGDLAYYITASGADDTDFVDQVTTQILGDTLTANATQFAGQTITAGAGVTIPTSIASPTNITAATGVVLSGVTHTGAVIPTVTTTTTATNVTTVNGLAANVITAAATATDFGTEIATALWTDTTAGDFTVALSVGKSVMNGVALGTGLTINAYTGNTAQTGDSFARIGAAGAGLTNIGTIATVTNLTNLPAITANWLTAAGTAADFTTEIQAGLATPTNITAGTITTVTNLTNAPTAGDLTATMKTSVKTQVTDGLAVDTYVEPGQGTPASTTTLAAKINYLYKAFLNKVTQTATTQSIYNNAATVVDQKATVSDDGTTFARTNITTGP